MLSGGAATWPLHPFLFGAAAVFSLYAANLRETTFADVAPRSARCSSDAHPLSRLWCGPAAVRPTRRDPCQRRARRRAPLRGPHPLAEPVRRCRASGGERACHGRSLAIAVALVAVWLARFSMALPNTMLNGIAFVLLAVPVWQVGAHAWKSTYDLPASGASGGGAADLSFGGSAVAAPSLAGELPDIYYFIFDRYASQSVLSREYGFDNQDFIDFLQVEGLLRRLAQPLELPEDCHLARLVLVHGLHQFPVREEGRVRIRLAADLRHARQSSGRELPEERRATPTSRSARGGGRPSTTLSPTRTTAFGFSEFNWSVSQKDDAAAAPRSGLSRQQHRAALALGLRPMPARAAADGADQRDRRAGGADLPVRAHPPAARALRLRRRRSLPVAGRGGRARPEGRLCAGSSTTPTRSCRMSSPACSTGRARSRSSSCRRTKGPFPERYRTSLALLAGGRAIRAADEDGHPERLLLSRMETTARSMTPSRR